MDSETEHRLLIGTLRPSPRPSRNNTTTDHLLELLLVL